MKNAVIDSILMRRTIRKFKAGGPISDEAMDGLVQAGMASPTGFDARPWHFVTIQDADLMQRLAAAMPGCDSCALTASAVLICGDSTGEKLPGIWVQDCSACAQNIQLAAHAQGLGAVWLAMYLVEERVQACRKLLGVPEPIIPFALIAVGVPDETGNLMERYIPERVHRNGW